MWGIKDAVQLLLTYLTRPAISLSSSIQLEVEGQVRTANASSAVPDVSPCIAAIYLGKFSLINHQSFQETPDPK